MSNYKAPAFREEIIERAKKALPILNQLVEDIAWIEDSQSAENMTEQQRYYARHLKAIKYRDVDYAPYRLAYMFAPVDAEGTLVKRSDGRYEIAGTSIYFTSGSCCEILVPYREDYDPEYDEAPFLTWIYTTIEHRNDNYYFTARPDIPMDGARVRTKGIK